MATETSQENAIPAQSVVIAARVPQVVIYSHSWILYWWPSWVAGYVMAFLTWMNHINVQIGNTEAEFYPSNNMGVVFCLILVLNVLLTGTNLRGLLSAVVAVSAAFVILFFAYMNWWDPVLEWFGKLSVHLNMGFYMFFSTALGLVWLVIVFGFDHLTFWRVRPGQITHEMLLGAADRSYDTDNMVFTKSQGDLFRHWFLGLGSGDLVMRTLGGTGMTISIPNVPFVGAKVRRIEKLIATKPGVEAHA